MTLFDSYCDCGVSAAIGVQHRGPKSGRKLVTLFDSYCDGGVNAAVGVQHTGCKLVTLFGGYYYDSLIAAIGVQHRQVPNLGVSWSCFWRLL